MGQRHHLARVAMFAGLLATTSACASSGVYRAPTSAPRVDARAYRNGYDAGSVEGANDARRGRRFEIDRNRLYRSADRGYDGYGNRVYYQQAFRDGYANGYTDGYRRNDRSDRRGYPAYGNGGYRSPAADNGYRDGYEQGRDDRRDGDRYDPVRASRYREGDHNYNSRYGSRDDYRREYRSAFQEGYRRGYEEARR